MSTETTILKGSSTEDMNSNYEHNISNIRRQLQAKVESEFNTDFILSHFPNGQKFLEMHGKEIHIHDFKKLLLLPYCYSYSLLPLVVTGLQYNDEFKSRPAKRVSSFATHVREFLSHVAIRTRGACAFPDLFVCMTYYVKKFDLLNDSDEIFSEGQTKREFLGNIIQSLFYAVNQNLREGAESMFSNISFFDRHYLEGLFKDNYYETLGINTDDILEVQKFVMEWHTNEVTNVKMLRWPVVTIALLKNSDGKILDDDFLEFACAQNMKHSIYNFLVLDNPASIASCCRLINQGDHPYLNSYGSGSVSIGSHQVVSLNLPHIYCKYGEEQFEETVKTICDQIMEFLNWHREMLRNHRHLDNMYELGIRDLDRMFSTFGTIGYADLKKIAGWSNEKHKQFAEDLSNYIESYNAFVNLELVPAESAAVSLFDKDKELFPEVDFYREAQMYSNQIVSTWDDIGLFEKMQLTGEVAHCFSGGTMTFITIPEQPQTVHQMVRIICGVVKSNVPYFAFDTQISTCGEHSTLTTADICPICGGDIINRYRRVVGFFVPLDHMYERETRDVPHRN